MKRQLLAFQSAFTTTCLTAFVALAVGCVDLGGSAVEPTEEAAVESSDDADQSASNAPVVKKKKTLADKIAERLAAERAKAAEEEKVAAEQAKLAAVREGEARVPMTGKVKMSINDVGAVQVTPSKRVVHAPADDLTSGTEASKPATEQADGFKNDHDGISDGTEESDGAVEQPPEPPLPVERKRKYDKANPAGVQTNPFA